MGAETMTAEQQCKAEELAAKLRLASRLSADGAPEGTEESLKRCVSMLDTYGPECFPANEQGQIHFARAMMESVADEITAFLTKSKADRDAIAAECGRLKGALKEIRRRETSTERGTAVSEIFVLADDALAPAPPGAMATGGVTCD